MSGGVDSSVAAAMLHSDHEEIVGVFMRNGIVGAAGHRSCCSLSDSRDARAVASRLDIPFYVHDMSLSFARLMQDFSEDYVSGKTPNPCVVCNQRLKFGDLFDLADDLGCEGVATGHYAQIQNGRLLRSVDDKKDQSYLLAGLSPTQLSRSIFPLGAMRKEEVRGYARSLGLNVADKPDSVDICFVPGGDYREVVEERVGNLGKEGWIVDQEGTPLAEHDGIGRFTVGQRRGLGLAMGYPAYVTSIDPDSGEVAIGPSDALSCLLCHVEEVVWQGDLSLPAHVSVQLRHHHQAEPAVIESVEGSTEIVAIHFSAPSVDVTPGQYAVFYQGDAVLGSGRISRKPVAESVTAGATAEDDRD